MTEAGEVDRSNGYEAVSEEFISLRTRSGVGAGIVRGWAETLPEGAAVLDLGCGHGVPVAELLLDAGLRVYGVDASPSMVAAFRARFPDVPVECAPVEESHLFGRPFDAAIAWGLLFLLTADAQADLIRKVAGALKRGGSFLFTAPREACEWPDTLTGRPSVSLGSEAYERVAGEAGLILRREARDEGENHYYMLDKPGAVTVGHGRGDRGILRDP